MQTTRMEAFSDGVIAIILTIMVLELRVPDGADWSALGPVLPVFFGYVLSFLYLAIYWNNHHHMLHATDHVDGKILWANLHLLFWLSLVPFATNWMSQTHFARSPVALYGVLLLLAAVSYSILQWTIIQHSDANERLRQAVGRDWKGKLSIILYAAALPLTFLSEWISIALYFLVALMWLVPDKRIEREFGH